VNPDAACPEFLDEFDDALTVEVKLDPEALVILPVKNDPVRSTGENTLAANCSNVVRTL